MQVLTMALEFERDVAWTDWKGAQYHARDEFRCARPSARRP